MYQILKILKDEFRRWYGTLSIEEIMENLKLIEAIEQTEKVFQSIEASYPPVKGISYEA